MKTRLVYIDIAKGFAILCVVFGHILCYDLYGFQQAWNESRLLNFICQFHMPLFIFLSGLVSPTFIDVRSIPADFWKRFRTILLPGIIIGSIYSLSFSGDLGFITNDMKYGYWYLWVLFFYYIILYGINISLKRLGGGKTVIIFLIALLLWWVVNHEFKKLPIDVINTLSLDLIVAYFPYFFIANMVKRYGIQERVFGDSKVFILAISLWMCSPLLTFSYSNYLTTIASIISIIYICKMIENNYDRIKQCMSYIGTQTLYIYVFHYFAVHGFKTTCFYDILPSYSNICWDFLLCILPVTICVLFSLFIGRIVQSNPLIMKYVFGNKK